ncbi:MAG TPA: cupin domain-containing protein [Chthoniobacteraceae bacterium]|nr:cupin domain-containing protein [Chthoniobacteraceae bacterium]
MLLSKTTENDDWFKVLQTTKLSQTAVMNLAPGQASGDEAEAHEESDQVLYVVEGEVTAEIAGETGTLRAGEGVTIPAGVKHRFVNETRAPVRTFNVYTPPAY